MAFSIHVCKPRHNNAPDLKERKQLPVFVNLPGMATQLLNRPLSIRRTHAFTRLKHKHTPMPIQEPHDDHFTSEDRKALTEISVHMSYVRDAIGSMKDASTRIDTKMETLHNQTDKKIETLNSQADKKMETNYDRLDSRIRALENWRWWIMGAALAGGGIGGVAAKLIGH